MKKSEIKFVHPIGEFKFNFERDVQEVEQFGFVDLVSAFENHAIPADLMVENADFNGIEDPDKILGKPRNTFDALHMKSAIENYKPDAKSE